MTSMTQDKLMPAGSRMPGFTAVELLMALSISSLVMLALSAILTSVAQGWTHTENARGYVMSESAGMLRIERLLRNCRLTGAHNAGSIEGAATPAYLVLWAEDRQANGAMELGEIAILEHDPASRTVRLWEIPGQTALHEQVVPRAVLDDPGSIAVFKAISEARPRIFAVNVATMALWVHPAVVEHQKRQFEYAVMFDRPLRRGQGDAPRVTLYGSAAMRMGDPSVP